MNFKLKLTPLRIGLSVFGVLLLLVVGFLSTGQRIANISMYSEHPVAVDCAYRAIAKMEGVSEATPQKYVIAFGGSLFSGQLFHGTEGEDFNRYGLDLSISLLSGEDIDSLTQKVWESLRDTCAPA